MGAEFVVNDKGTCLFINGFEITYYHTEEHIDHSGKKVNFKVCANDFQLDNDEIIELLKLTISDIPKCFDFYKQGFKSINDASLNIIIDNYHVGLVVEHNLETWSNPYSYTDFVKCYSNLLADCPFKVEEELALTLGFDESYEEPMLPQVEEAINWLNKCYFQAKAIMMEVSSNDVLTKVFDFPPEYKSACIQYLIWFGEFLKSLDINTKISTEDSNEETLLVITPDNCPELLEKIENLFYQYIELPYVEVLPPQETFSPQELYAYQSAVLQVQHLKTQIQMKDSVIASYKATNASLITQIEEQAKEPLLINSLKDENKFKLFGGLIEVNKKQKLGKMKMLLLIYRRSLENLLKRKISLLNKK